MSHPMHILCPSVVSLPAHPFTSVGLRSGARRRAFLTHRPNAQRMAIPMLIEARRVLERHFRAGNTPARLLEDCRNELQTETTRRWLGAGATVLLLVCMVIASAACTGLLRP